MDTLYLQLGLASQCGASVTPAGPVTRDQFSAELS